jgi:hypothetical protein
MSIEFGRLITGDETRDAVHVAVAPVVAGHTIVPGSHIGFVMNDNTTVGTLASKHIGIADPFLTSTIKKGDKFWMFLYPNTITSLRHNWTHPDFPDSDEVIGKSKAWIERWAAGYGMSYQMALEAGRNRDFFVGEVCYDNIPVEFWDNYEIVTGEKVQDKEGHHFHCAC